MLHALAGYAVPANMLLLMLIAGTEISFSDFSRLREYPVAVMLGSAGQLLFLPLLALLILTTVKLPGEISAGLLLLSMCPGGGISNYYCYLARCNVLLSATITAVSTVLSLISIPLWIELLPVASIVGGAFPGAPVRTIMAQLLVLMVLPLAVGMGLRHFAPIWIAKNAALLKRTSIIVILLILGLATWTTRHELAALFLDILTAAAAFIFSAMALGWVLGITLEKRDRAVLVVESGVRNISVALILGAAMLPRESFGTFASFLTGYFITEIVIMLTYARVLSETRRDVS